MLIFPFSVWWVPCDRSLGGIHFSPKTKKWVHLKVLDLFQGGRFSIFSAFSIGPKDVQNVPSLPLIFDLNAKRQPLFIYFPSYSWAVWETLSFLSHTPKLLPPWWVSSTLRLHPETRGSPVGHWSRDASSSEGFQNPQKFFHRIHGIGIFTYICYIYIYMVNVGNYTIHGASRLSSLHRFDFLFATCQRRQLTVFRWPVFVEEKLFWKRRVLGRKIKF